MSVQALFLAALVHNEGQLPLPAHTNITFLIVLRALEDNLLRCYTVDVSYVQ